MINAHILPQSFVLRCVTQLLRIGNRLIVIRCMRDGPAYPRGEESSLSALRGSLMNGDFLLAGRVYLEVSCRFEGIMWNNSADDAIQLIPGHEAIGTIVEMGKNVKGFDMGDRCVADVGNTVSHTPLDFRAIPTRTEIQLSAMIVFIVDEVNRSYARISKREVSRKMVASPSISSSKRLGCSLNAG